MKTQILVTIILINFESSIFVLKQDHKIREFNENFFHKKHNQTYLEEIQYKTIYVKPIEKKKYICPDQREVCGNNYKTYKNRCSTPNEVHIVNFGRCTYNSLEIKKIPKKEKNYVFDDYGNIFMLN